MNPEYNEYNECHSRVDAVLVAADGSRSETETYLIKEHELEIMVNEQPVMKLICTKQDLHELVMGRLLTGGFIEKADDVARIVFCKYKNQASVFLNKEIDFQEAIAEEKTCCTGNKTWYTTGTHKPQKKLPSLDYKPEWIFNLARKFKDDTSLHNITSGTHSCMLAKGDEILYVCEDIGRHNAIDKAVGYGIMNSVPLSQCILYTSGRVPVDMAEKAIAAGVPVLASKSVPTVEAVEMGKEYGLVVIGKAHVDGFVVF